MMMKNGSVAGVSLVVLIASIAFLARTSSVSVNAQPAAASPNVKIDNFSFGPATLTVSAGTTVTWTNRDDIPHTVVSTESAFKSKAMDTDEKFSQTFAKPGTYSYFCSIHPKMTGKVVVQ
jgi:amicyanin